MPNVAATKYGKAGSTLVSSWTTARETGNFVNNQETGANVTTVLAQRGSKNGINYRVTRSFLAFDLSAYAGQTISNLTLNFRQTSSTVAGGLVIAILKSTAQGSGSTFSDLAISDFFTTIDFSTEYATWIPFMSSVNSNNVQPLNSAAMVDASSGSLRLAIVQAQNDANDLQPSSDQEENGNWNLDTSSSGFIPFLAFTATNWGEKVNSVPITTIEKVNGVPRSTIESINRFESTVAGSYFFWLADFYTQGTPNWIQVWTSVNPPSAVDVDDVLYTDATLNTPIGAGSEQLVGLYGPNDCGSIPTVISTNSDGEITAMGCAPV